MTEFLESISLLPVVLTLGAYLLGLWCRKKWNHPLVNPLLIAVVLFTGRRASLLAGTRLAWAVDTSDLDPDTTYALPLPVAEEMETDEAAATDETVEEPQEEGTENA